MKVRLVLLIGIAATLLLVLGSGNVSAAPPLQDTGTPAVTLTPLGTYDSGFFDVEAAEIVTYDPATQRAFVVNGGAKTIDVLDISDPSAPALVSQIDVTQFGGGANSVDFRDGVLAAAVEAEDKTANGSVVFLDSDGNLITSVEVGPLPDMVTFTPDGAKVLTANEGEPNDDYTVDPEGSISIVDVSGGVENVTAENVTTADFTAFNDAELDPSIRIFGPDATVAQDLEPEYIAVSPDSSTAFVTLQENNALAVVDLAAGEVTSLVALGFKNYNAPVASMTMVEFDNRPLLGTTTAGQEILLGGFSGLFFEGVDEATGELRFVTHPDRGPNAEPFDVDGDGVNERPFPLPDFQSELVRFTYSPVTQAMTITERIRLTRGDGTPITGLPNLAGEAGMAFADEEPVDLLGNPLELDPYGADMEGVAVADDGSFWMVDEYRPAIYHFDPAGVLINRYVPEGSNHEEDGIEVGVEALPEVLAQRRANRGFEAVALHNGILYAFIQSPLDNPDTDNDANSKASTLARIIAFDTAAATTIGQYLYVLDGGAVDKIGDAVALPDGDFLVIERDDAIGPDAQKFIYKVSLANATNIHARTDLPVEANRGLERQSALGLARAGIVPAAKSLFVDLGALGYTQGDKPEGLALIDENTLAVINDNDFGLVGTFDPATGLLDENPAPVPVILGLIDLRSNGLDASDRDDTVNIRNWPVLGMYMPDAIAAYEVAGELYLITANEGDARAYDGFDEETRVGDILLDLAAYPNAAELQDDANLGRLRTSTTMGDADGDGLVEQIYSFGGRSFTIWDSQGNVVWDSGDELAQITAAAFPADFNASGENDTFDARSDDKGVEPEAVILASLNERIYAFVGLERIGGVMIYDVTDPHAPAFVDYVNPRDFAVPSEDAGDLAPEGLKFVPADASPTGEPLLIISNELSGTTTIFTVDVENQ